MMRRSLFSALAMWLGCVLSVHGQAGGSAKKEPAGPEPNRLAAQMPATGLLPNPALEQSIVRTLQESRQLFHYRVNVIAVGGKVDLIGEIASESQRETLLKLLRTVPGITNVRDFLQIRPAVDLASMQPQMPPFLMPPGAVTPAQGILPPQPVNPNPGNNPGPLVPGGKSPERIDGQLPEPQPIFQAPLGPNPMIQPPPMPPYAWPTFAPYNNYSRIAYPNAYPYEQWPFIGPIYPFPKVPLGWRSVSLTWDDGFWWYHRNPTGHDWWRIRYH